MGGVTLIIQSLVAPVVMISACGLLCLALYNRLAAVVARLRGFHHEELDAIHGSAAGAAAERDTQLARVRLDALTAQVRQIARRARLLRNALFCLMLCVLFMLLCTLALGLSLAFEAMKAAALCLFFVGVLWSVAGIILALMELARSLDPVMLEQESIEHLRDTV